MHNAPYDPPLHEVNTKGRNLVAYRVSYVAAFLGRREEDYAAEKCVRGQQHVHPHTQVGQSFLSLCLEDLSGLRRAKCKIGGLTSKRRLQAFWASPVAALLLAWSPRISHWRCEGTQPSSLFPGQAAVASFDTQLLISITPALSVLCRVRWGTPGTASFRRERANQDR